MYRHSNHCRPRLVCVGLECVTVYSLQVAQNEASLSLSLVSLSPKFLILNGYECGPMFDSLILVGVRGTAENGDVYFTNLKISSRATYMQIGMNAGFNERKELGVIQMFDVAFQESVLCQHSIIEFHER